MTRLLNAIGILVLVTTTAVVPLLLATRTGADRDAIAAADLAYAEALATADRDPDGAKARFLECASAFARANPGRTSSGALFNEANALLRGGRPGPAIAAYRAALDLDPGSPHLEANLVEARKQVARAPGVPEPTALERAARLWSGTSEIARWAAGVGLAWIAFGVAGSRPRRLAWIPAALAAAVGATVAIDVAARAASTSAVLVAEAPLRKGNGEGFEPMLVEPLPEGTECRVLETRPGWTEIEIAGPTRGWVREDSVLRIR